MRRTTLILAGAVVVLALAAPAYAGFRVLSDTYNPQRGTGVAVLMITPHIYAEVGYRDMDRSMNFSAGDVRWYTHYYHPQPGSVLPTLTPLTQQPVR